MKTSNVHGVSFNDVPQVIVPIVGSKRDEIVAQARLASESKADIIEWRIDFFDQWNDTRACCDVAAEIADMCAQPLLGTFRSAREGGNGDILADAYTSLLQALSGTGAFWALDVEAFWADIDVSKLIDAIHGNKCAVVASYHDFNATPSTTNMCVRLRVMEQRGSDIAKIATMPRDMSDVARLLEATALSAQALDIPVITMSMGELGALSRIVGAQFGSVATFASLDRASAPGQLPLDDVVSMIESISR